MHVHPVLLAVWAAMAACFLAIIAYRSQITRYEEDQLFLNENANTNEQEEQTEIVRKVHKLEPLVRIFGGAAAIMTVCVVGNVVWQAWQALN